MAEEAKQGGGGSDAAPAGAGGSRPEGGPAGTDRPESGRGDGGRPEGRRPGDGPTPESLAASLAGARAAAGDGTRPGRATEGDARAGDEERAREQEEFRATRSRGLGTYGIRTSAIVITGDGHTFSGPMAAGDSITGGGGRADMVANILPAWLVAEVAQVYVPPGGYDEIRRAADRQSLLLLRSCRRWGATATAIELLRDLERVHDLLFAGDLATLPVESLPEGCGFILDRVTARQVALRAQDLPVLSERLAKRRSRLVVVLDDQARIADPAVERATRRIAAPPAAVELLASHLTVLLGSAARAESLLADPEVAAELTAVGPDSFDAAQLVELARDLAEVDRHELTVADALTRFRDLSQRDVDTWYDGIETLDQRALVLSLAALPSMTYDAVARAASRLEQAWRAEDGGAGTPPPRDRRPRAVRLRGARARIGREVRYTRYGPAEVEVPSFLDGSYPEHILRYAWQEHDYDRDLLLRWLRAVADDVEGNVGIRAAMSIGYLSRWAFDPIRRDIVTSWAGSGHGGERERAVAALHVAARYPETAVRVIRMVLDWCERGRGGPLRRTAARALGSSVGLVLADGPDEHLAELARDDDPTLHVAIGDSIAELMLEADPERQIELLGLLDDWSGERQSGRQSAGVLGFLEVAASTWRTETTPDDKVRWPLLLWLSSVGATTDPALAPIRPVIARLWGRALVGRGTDHAVHRVLRGWAGSAERWPELRPHLIHLLLEAAVTERQLGLLAGHARRWRHPEPLAPDVAARLLDVLDRRGRG
ncbi:hypothetical protein [Micromonospora siamensis]|uniref:Uncharacterized protein n=1 Tax=Micromonospora siamensis TaxID=299152 RepID=A0A1C5JQX0_9ACTN|nr:hypothetical protein [Micromonospora siamensis]SCG72995.1 hypothetical protein GA0074704_4848 [Micromonospora siamensis]